MRIIKIDDKYISSFTHGWNKIKVALPFILINVSKYPTHIEGTGATIAYDLFGRRVTRYIGNTPIVVVSWESPYFVIDHNNREIDV